MKVRTRLSIAVGLLLLTAAAGWLGWHVLQRDADAAVDAAVLAMAAPAASAPRALVNAWTPPAAQQGHASAVLQSSPATVDDVGPEDAAMEICGLGLVTRQQAERWGPVELMKAKAQMDALDRRKDAAMSQLSARLSAGTDVERVAARLVMKDMEGAAAIAAGSGDAAAYGLALQSCAKVAEPQSAPSCRGLTAQGWARLDPDDAAPWLSLGGWAMARRDEAAAADALEQALQRRKLSPQRPLLRAVSGVNNQGADAIGLGLAMMEIIGIDAMSMDWSRAMLIPHCSAEALKDGVRRGRCERYARWLFEHADSVLDASLALSIADRVGLPADQRPFTRAQLDEGQQRVTKQAMDWMGLDCAGLARGAHLPALLLQQTELQQALHAVPGR